MVRSLASRPARRGADEAGFSLIELLVALLVLALVLVSVAYSLTSALTNVGFSRQQQAATGLANKAIEEIRGLPYSTLKDGLNSSDTTISSDTNISSWTFTPTNEPIVHSSWAPGTQIAPLNPHISQSTVNKTNYTVATYVTYYNGTTSEYRVTSIVTWTPSDRPGASAKVSEQTVIFSPDNGCLSPTTHPYAAPCQPFFQATATIGQGFIQIEAPSGYVGDAISGIPLTTAELYLPRADSNIDLEQIANLLGGANTSGGTIGEQGQPNLSVGQIAGLVQADSDPGSNTAPASSSPLAQVNNSIQASSGSSNPNTLTITPGASDGGSAVATTAASTALSSSGGSAPSCGDLGYPQNPQSSGQPCEDATVSPSSGLAAVLDLFAGSQDLGDASLASVAAPSGSITTGSFAERFTSNNTAYCLNASGDGCVHAAAQRQVGTVTVGGLPPQVIADGVVPAGWSTSSDLFQLSNYSDSASVEAGIGTASPAYSVSVPAAGQTAPSLKYYNGTGYTTVTWPAGSTSYTTAPVSLTDTVVGSVGGTLTVNESATISIGAASHESSGSSPCSSSCTLNALVSSPVVADVSYAIVWNGTTLANLLIHVDLGTLSANAVYQEAPSAG